MDHPRCDKTIYEHGQCEEIAGHKTAHRFADGWTVEQSLGEAFLNAELRHRPERVRIAEQYGEAFFGQESEYTHDEEATLP